MFEILLHAINWQHFFYERFPGNDFGAFGNPVLVAVVRVYLIEPASVPITGRTYENLGMEIAEMEGLEIGLGLLEHDFILDEKNGLPNFMIKNGFGYPEHIR